MQLPRVLLIGDRFTDPKQAAKIKMAVQAGIRWVQLRDHNASTDGFDVASMRLTQDLLHINRNVLITINSRIKVAQAHSMHFHTGKHGPSICESILVLGAEASIGMSVHDGKELAVAVNHKAHYIAFSPIFHTKSHPDVRPVGLEVLKKVCGHAGNIPVFALGGINPSNASSCLHAGAYGVAVHSAILDAPNPIIAIQQFSQVIPGL